MRYNESRILGGMVVIVEPGDKAKDVMSYAGEIGAYTLGGADMYYHLRLPGQKPREDKYYTHSEIKRLAKNGWKLPEKGA